MELYAPPVNRITREELHWCPYKIKVRQQLQENDSQRRPDFSYWFLRQ